MHTPQTKIPQRHYHEKKNTLYEERNKDQSHVGQNNHKASNSPNPSRSKMTLQ
jgi:hypothetical protein